MRSRISKTLALAALLLALGARSVAAQAAFVAGASGSGSAVATIDTTTFSVGSEANRVLWAFCAFTDAGVVTNTAASWDPTGANQALSAVAATFANGNFKIRAWKLISPNTLATKVVRCTFSAAPSVDMAVVAGYWSGADQTTGISDVTTASGTTGNPSVTVTNVVSGDGVVDLQINDNAGGDTAGTNQTRVGIEENRTNVYNGSRKNGANNGTMTWTVGSHTVFTQVGVRIIQAAASGCAPTLMLLGVERCH